MLKLIHATTYVYRKASAAAHASSSMAKTSQHNPHQLHHQSKNILHSSCIKQWQCSN
uniref:Uncharacterized protein n=1 Tax=Arundo donax TaxID=35708 RepID=A0A0A9GNX9_ARUDO